MLKADWVTEYIAELAKRAEDRRAEGAPSADVYARVASELEARRRAFMLATPTTAEAVAESGYSEQGLRKLKKDGVWSGQRFDMPRRPGTVKLEARGLTLAEEVLSSRRRVG